MAWWWPSEDSFWPSEAALEEFFEAFVVAFGTMGFEVCDNGEAESGFQKIVVYGRNNLPTHAARQLRNGRWTSKLGRWYDIEHDAPEALSGAAYGDPILYLKRAAPF